MNCTDHIRAVGTSSLVYKVQKLDNSVNTEFLPVSGPSLSFLMS